MARLSPLLAGRMSRTPGAPDEAIASRRLGEASGAVSQRSECAIELWLRRLQPNTWATAGLLEAVQQRLDNNPQAMRMRRETAEHPFGTLKMRMGATHFLMKTLPRVATE